ncbi:hypothetical protein GTA08_BOTSDO09440 [Neofusicoccum parvum]|uniref:Uncharacterized protein n=1 Tax=Neofusicoccum parvum TaxID=310453 RepID=A0ACB5S332_9PEZI|nr:hypothetical protein GTA08_BOTSDO09440 [Neofusicoccum parvum]
MSSSTSTPYTFTAIMPSFGALNWDYEYEQLNAAAVFSENSFAAGLEQFGKLSGSWEDEYDELCSDGIVCTQTTSDNSCAAPEVDMSTRPDGTELFTFDNDIGSVIVHSSASTAVNSDTIQNDKNQQPMIEESANASRGQTPILNIPADKYFPDHPGWSLEESPSLSSDSSTSPEVCTWVMSSNIFQDIKWIMDANNHDQVNLDFPRVASCLNRAVYHLYLVPLDASIRYPYKAWGEKDYYRSYGAEVHFPRGAKGLKKASDPDVPKKVYIPNGMKKGALRAKATQVGEAFYPQPSRLSQIETISYEVIETDEMKKSAAISFVSGENYLESSELENVAEVQDALAVGEAEFQPYNDESESEAAEELSLTEEIEPQFELEIDGSSLSSHVADEDDEWFYNSGESSCPSTSDTPQLTSNGEISPSTSSEYDFNEEIVDNTGFEDFIIFHEDGKLSDTCTHIKLTISDADGVQDLIDDSFDHSDFAASIPQKLPQIPSGYRWTASSFAPIHHGPRLIVQADSGYNSAASDEDLDLYEHDEYTSEIDGDDLDEALARLESMDVLSINKLIQRNPEDPELDTSTKDISIANNIDEPFSTHDFASGYTGVDKPYNSICVVEGLGGALASHVETATSKTSGMEAKHRASIYGSSEQSSTPEFDGPPTQPAETPYVIFDVVAAVVGTIMSLMSANPFSVWLF